MRAAPVRRGRLSSRPGALLQIVVIAGGAIALPGGSLLSPVLLAGVAAAMLWISGDDWRSVGFGPPTRHAFWWVITAVLVGVLWQYAAAGVLAPLASRLLNSPLPSNSTAPGGTVGLALSLLAFGLVHPLAKGLAYRGFLLSRLERAFGSSALGVAVSFLIASIVFGLGSLYQGPAGVVTGALTGAIFSGLYYWARRNVWPSVLAQGVFNSAALSLLWLGTLATQSR